MGRELRLIFISIANSLNPSGYHNIVSPPRKLNETASKVNRQRGIDYKQLKKETDEQISRIAAY